jgi:hypothetical protein
LVDFSFLHRLKRVTDNLIRCWLTLQLFIEWVALLERLFKGIRPLKLLVELCHLSVDVRFYLVVYFALRGAPVLATRLELIVEFDCPSSISINDGFPICLVCIIELSLPEYWNHIFSSNHKWHSVINKSIPNNPMEFDSISRSERTVLLSV